MPSDGKVQILTYHGRSFVTGLLWQVTVVANGMTFTVTEAGLPQDACVTLATKIGRGQKVTTSINGGTAACAANGMVGRTSTGRSLSCDNQVWVVNGSSAPTCTAKTINGYDANDATTYSCPVGYTKVGWDTTGSGQRNSSTPGIVIGQNDYATIFCCQF
ncbi:type 4 pilus major pilin [Pseudomonas syringae pv. tagetis]|uniref:Type 4 pilus major pilin n=1 Tax=Pseudomonas syringae pv. tagetis TaxID=129140 RepID=A0ABW7NQP4_9PSED|nr:type 4 pilus major pilin [Pseudomonas syringae group genomosp. 7]